MFNELLARVYSFKLIICAAFLWLALLVYGLALYSTQIYRELAVENQTESIQLILETESRRLIDNLHDQQIGFVDRVTK